MTSAADGTLPLLHPTVAACLEQIQRLSVNVGTDLPDPAAYAALYHLPEKGSYSRLPEPLLAAAAKLNRQSSTLCEAYNRYLMVARLEVLAQQNPGSLTLPDSVTALLERQRQRIASLLASPPPGYLSLDFDPFLKDLAITIGQFIPLGAEFALPDAGIPRNLLLRGGFAQRLRFGWFMLRQHGCLQGYLELHAHPLDLGSFNPEGWSTTLDNLAALLRANPGIPGAFSTSWFLDPQLQTISPRLAYLREMSLTSGASLFLVGEDPSGNSGALQRSPTRKRLFASGQYIPRIYTRIWERKRLLG
ncbi:MAG: hypothetical protein ACK5HY_04845 [Parahaliea sp.]